MTFYLKLNRRRLPKTECLRLRNESLVNQKSLKLLLDYNPETGVFTRIKNVGPRGPKGGIVGTPHGVEGYLGVKINSVRYKLHRLAFLYMTGKWPKTQVDHRDLNVENNKWSNLREATQQQNQCNKKIHKCNKTGYKGVTPEPRKDGTTMYRASITHNSKTEYLGCYTTAKKAHKVYRIAAKRYHGDFYKVA